MKDETPFTDDRIMKWTQVLQLCIQSCYQLGQWDDLLLDIVKPYQADFSVMDGGQTNYCFMFQPSNNISRNINIFQPDY